MFDITCCGIHDIINGFQLTTRRTMVWRGASNRNIIKSSTLRISSIVQNYLEEGIVGATAIVYKASCAGPVDDARLQYTVWIKLRASRYLQALELATDHGEVLDSKDKNQQVWSITPMRFHAPHILNSLCDTHQHPNSYLENLILFLVILICAKS